jgi:hypothetical protein
MDFSVAGLRYYYYNIMLCYSNRTLLFFTKQTKARRKTVDNDLPRVFESGVAWGQALEASYVWMQSTRDWRQEGHRS